VSIERERWITDRVSAAGLASPTDVQLAHGGGSVAVAFEIDGVTETVEGCGGSDEAAADDVIRQLRVRLAQ
jgi:hypothetical protein